MNLVYGEIVAIYQEGEMRVGKIRVGGAIKNVLLDLVIAAEIGDSVLLCDGVAIARVDPENSGEKLCV
ncbi:MAG: HypC/HybG/HupF family hydrogenase formation chaperone [Verrucomicrobia bacterium]|jgi:hydrogenase maturation factor|nr:HypC/HybG/HupF family hydrogenase formation chaperone [Verrucomicrobiota bacterium]